MKVKSIVETYRLEREPYGHSATEHGDRLDDLINDFISDKHVIDIKYDGTSPRSALVIYEEVE